MPLIQLDVKMLPMKVHYFLFMGGVAPMTTFLPTIAKQFGYSTAVVGVIYGILPILSLLIKPLVGAIVDQFRVKRIIFLTFILFTGITSFSLMFVPEVPLKTTVELNCKDLTFLNVCPQNTASSFNCNAERVMEYNTKNRVQCELKCENSDQFRNVMCKNWMFNDYCIADSFNSNTSNDIQTKKLQKIKPKTIKQFYNDDYVYLYGEIQMNHTDRENNCFYFRLELVSLLFNDSEKVNYSPYCDNKLKSQCEIQCSNVIIMDLITPQEVKKNAFELTEFWILFLLVSLFWINQAAVYSLADSICFDQLGNKPNLYGKQRCWGSIGWGVFSIFAGWLVDIVSSSDVNKNYFPIYFLCLLVILCNLYTASKLEISETKISTSICKDIRKLLAEVKVLGFLIWTIIIGICTAMIWNYLLWYIEEVASMYECKSQAWIKTLQGLMMGVQCFGGEVPLFFWSGWIIKRLGHLNCMSLVLGVFAFRFFAYSILTNPIWVLFIELTNGITFGLAYAVLMSYASVIALPGTESAMIGLVGGVFEGVGVALGSLLGGYLYNIFGGVDTFRIFAFGSALMCIIHFSCQNLLKTNGKLSLLSCVNDSTEYASPNEAIHMLSEN